MALAAEGIVRANEGEDELQNMAFWRLTMVCSSWLKYHPPGDEGYQRSLVGAAVWSPVVLHGGKPDRRYSIACVEADLTRAMMQLPKMQRDICVLSRSDPRDRGWARRWNQQMTIWNGAFWNEYLEQQAVPDEGKIVYIRLTTAIKALLREAAEGMAEILGVQWLYT